MPWNSIHLFIHFILFLSYPAGQEALCVVCHTSGRINEQLFCTSCGQHYHGNCLDPPVEVNPGVRAGWQCPECKICQMCRQPGDDNKMLVCDTCDKGYHTFCLRPVMTTIPKNGWKCKVWISRGGTDGLGWMKTGFYVWQGLPLNEGPAAQNFFLVCFTGQACLIVIILADIWNILSQGM